MHRDWNLCIHHVSMYVNLPVIKWMPFLATCSMAQSRKALQFSTVELLIMVLRKLAAEDFASENLPHHSAIWRQIKSLLQSPAEHKFCVWPCNRNYSGKCRYWFEVEFWLQFYIYRIGDVPHNGRKLSATCTLLSAFTAFVVNTSTIIITNSFVVVSAHPAAQASEVLRNKIRWKLCPYISVRSNLLALNAWLLQGAIFGQSISVNSTIVGHKMTATVRAQWRHWVFREFQ